MNSTRYYHPIILSILLSLCCSQTLSASRTFQPAPTYTPPVIKFPDIKTPTTRTQRRLQPVSTSPKISIQPGFCCKDGTINRATEKICQKRRGLFFSSERAAKNRCTQDRGFCCKNGSIDQATINTCKKDRGAFYHLLQNAKKQCRAYCCSNFKVTEKTEQQCKALRGKTFATRQQADKFCVNQKGYCNHSGKTLRITKSQCLKMEGNYFTSSFAAQKNRIKRKQQKHLRQDASHKNLSVSPKTLKATPITSSRPTFMLPADSDCREYAKKAVALAEIAGRSFCNFKGNRWSDDTNQHFSWCMSVSPAKRLQEANQRLAEYQKCNDCGIYAQEALWQFAQVEKNMCNLSGSGWHNDRDQHFNWCMNASPADRINESTNRKKALENCGDIKLFAHPLYMNMVLDFCMYRRPETYSSTSIEGEIYDYDFGWDCGNKNVTDSYCISRGYNKTVNFKISASPSSVDTIPIGNTHICDATIAKANCRGFDHIICRKWNGSTSEVPHQAMATQSRNASLKNKEMLHKKSVTVVSPEAACKQYAQTSVEQFHQANASWCTVGKAFEPWRWHGNITKHYEWCLTASPAQRLSEIAKRDGILQECEQWQRTFFDKPSLCGIRVDIYLNSRKGNQLESNVPQRAADAFCRRQGYEKAVKEWSLYNSSYKPEHLKETIHLGDDDNNNNCNLHEINGLAGCNIYPSIRDDCTAFNHIICEKPASP